MRLSIALVFLFAIGCAHSNTPVASPENVPPSAIEAICSKLHNEGLNGDLAIVRTTEPLITRETMISLSDAATYRGKKDPASFAAELSERPSQTLDISAATCKLSAIDKVSNASSDTMVLQLSLPFINPFARGSAGLFARLSLGNENAQWYWIPISRRGDSWYAGRPMPLALRS